MRPLDILTWHVHGNYLWYLSQCPMNFYLPVKDGHSPGYGGRGRTFPFGDNVHEIPATEVRRRQFDCVLYQCKQNYLEDRFAILSSAQQHLPSIYLEHDPPQQHPTDTRHWVDDPSMLFVHVTSFNRLMWDCGSTPTRVIEHGVIPPNAEYTGEIPRGIVVINHLRQRGRRLGVDVFEAVRESIPVDLVGMRSEELGGLGEITPTRLGQFIARYRFFFNPIRWTSLGLAVGEAMLIGMPIVGLATTEMVTAIEDGVSGFLDTNVDRLIQRMQRLIEEPELARQLGQNARRYASTRFDIGRFAREWQSTFREVAEGHLRPGISDGQPMIASA